MNISLLLFPCSVSARQIGQVVDGPTFLFTSLTGLFNIAFTQYVVEEPPVVTSVINTAAMEAADAVDKEQTPQPQTTRQTAAKYGTKETEL